MPSALPPDIVSKIAPRLLGYLFHWGLFGVLSAQVYIYHLAFPADPWHTKFYVYSVYCLEFTQTVFISLDVVHVFAQGFGDYKVYDYIGLAWFSIPVISGLVAFLAATFYAYRISILAESYQLPSVIVVLAMTQLAGSIAAAVEVKKAVVFSNLLSTRFTVATAFWNGGGALCDIIIAICMTFYLNRRASEGMADTQRLLKRVITVVIGTGIATASVAMVNLVLTAFPRSQAYYFASSEILAKIYSNSMMVLLNRRAEIRSDTQAESGTSTPSVYLPSIVFGRSETGMDGANSGDLSTPQNFVVCNSNTKTSGVLQLGSPLRGGRPNYGPFAFSDTDWISTPLS